MIRNRRPRRPGPPHRSVPQLEDRMAELDAIARGSDERTALACQAERDVLAKEVRRRQREDHP